MITHPWIDICPLADIAPNSGACAKLENRQVAIFHLSSKRNQNSSVVKAISNFDPYSKTNILSRGLITEQDQKLFVASPMLKQKFCLDTGLSEQDDNIFVTTYESRIHNGYIQLKGVS